MKTSAYWQRPGQTLWSDPFRSGIGRFSQRPIWQHSCSCWSFGAFANAAGMVGPVVKWQDQLRAMLGNPPQLFVTTAVLLLRDHRAAASHRERSRRGQPQLGQVGR